MATFQYEALNEAGKPQKGSIKAVSSEDAIARIRSQGLFPTSVREQKVKTKAEKADKGGKAKSAKGGKGDKGDAPPAKKKMGETLGRLKSRVLIIFSSCSITSA